MATFREEVATALRFSVAFISPNGSTGKVAGALADQLTGDGAEVFLGDLSDPAAGRDLIESVAAADETLLFIGSPVYKDLAVPPVPRRPSCWNRVQDCPVGAIALCPLPEFGDSCFSCFNCVRLCPEGAITSAFSLAQIEAHVRERVRTINEQPPSQVFLAAM